MRLLVKTLLFSAIWMAIACAHNSNSNKASNQPENAAAAAVKFDNETDFVCGMEVTPEFVDTCHYKGKVYAFCSESCKESFLEDPEKYLAGD